MNWYKRMAWLWSPHPPKDQARISYAIAYKVMAWLIRRHERVPFDEWCGDLKSLRLKLYRMGCVTAHQTIRLGQAKMLRLHVGSLDNRRDYLVVQYPDPPPMEPVPGGWMLPAPYFTTWIRDRQSGDCECYVLGQSPDGATTARLLQGELHTRLARGPEPVLEAWLVWLAEWTSREE
jgi:hypothetical protein